MSTTMRPPKGWVYGEYDDRVAAIRRLPRRVRVLLAAEWARSVLPIYAAYRPDDRRPQLAVETATAWALDPTDAADAAAAAADAAYAAYAAYADAYADADALTLLRRELGPHLLAGLDAYAATLATTGGA